jgi:hypothetical protein
MTQLLRMDVRCINFIGAVVSVSLGSVSSQVLYLPIHFIQRLTDGTL